MIGASHGEPRFISQECNSTKPLGDASASWDISRANLGVLC
jgi:hypothetical protein